jgi:tetratricopeptide (TPR) repeat protein
MSKSVKKLRIFAASPSDVASERAKLETVVYSLKPISDYLGLMLEVVDWRAVVPDAGRPQQVIFDQLKPTSWDIFIGILWHRFGTLPGAKDKRGKDYLSGTEEEFKTAHELWKQYGKPRIVIYRCTRVLPYDVDPDQLKHVREFFKLIEDVKGDYPTLYQAFDTTDSFEKLALDNLQKLLIEYSEQSKTPITHEIVQVYAPKIPNNLPRRQAFFGRAKEMGTVMRALSPTDRTWGVLVDGIGGIGKSAIAIEAAYRSQEVSSFDAFVFVTAKINILDPSGIRELTPPARTVDEFLNETARVLGQSGIAKLTGEEKRRALLDVLRTMRTLIIYDNLETLSKEEQEGIADFLRELPQGCKAIITSRRRGGEGAVWLRVEKLDWDAARGIIENETARDAGLANKLNRVGEARWQELFDETNGSPLALVHTLGLMRVRAALTFDGALEMLHGNRDADLQKFIFQEARKELTENDKAALGALSFFMPSATFDAWMQVGNLSRNALETTIDRLSALSLVDVLAGEDRYALHPLTRAFTRDELLVDVDVIRETGNRFARYWVNYAELYGSSSQRCAFCTLSNQWACSGRYGSNCSHKTYSQLGAEWSNLDVAVSWLWDFRTMKSEVAGTKTPAKLFVDLTHSISQFLWHSGSWDKRAELNAKGYEIAQLIKAWDDASWCADDVAWVHYLRGNVDLADTWAQRCEKAANESGSKNTIANAIRICGLVAQERKDYEQALHLLKDALNTWRALQNDTNVAIALDHLGSLACEIRNFAKSRQYYDEAMKLAQKINNIDIQAILCGNLGELALERDNWDEADIWFEKQFPLAEEVGSIDLIAQSQFGLARVHEAEGRADSALPLAQEALKIYKRLQHRDLAKVRELVDRLV